MQITTEDLGVFDHPFFTEDPYEAHFRAKTAFANDDFLRENGAAILESTQ